MIPGAKDGLWFALAMVRSEPPALGCRGIVRLQPCLDEVSQAVNEQRVIIECRGHLESGNSVAYGFLACFNANFVKGFNMVCDECNGNDDQVPSLVCPQLLNGLEQ